MRRITRSITIIFLALFAGGVATAQAGEATVAYFQSAAFNVPLLNGWQDQSGDDAAQFHLPAANATIRTTIVPLPDPVAAAKADLEIAFGVELDEPVYQGKVNLADGTWTSLVYEIDAVKSASVMARRVDAGSVVISLVERDPSAQLMTLAISRSDESASDAEAEIILAVESLGMPSIGASSREVMALPSGDWLWISGGAVTAMGMVFGNDSYIALADGESDHLPQIADAWNTTLLGFFITPDNSVYLALGLAASLAVLALLILSIFWRLRNAAQDLALIESLSDDNAGS